MKKALAVIGCIAFVVFIIGMVALSTYNGMVRAENEVDKAWADVQAVYQRRADVIPNIAKVAKFSMETQYKLNLEVAKLREGYGKAATPQDIEEIDKETAGLIMNLMARAEAAPQIDTAQLTELNAVIDSTERAINHQRDAFNETVRLFNNKVKTFPGKIFASGWGFTPKDSFRAQPGAETAPDIDLDFDLD